MGRLVEIAQFYDPEEAYCAKGFLGSHGIDVIIQNDHHLTVAPWLRFALGGYRLLAMSELKDEAVRLLNTISETVNAEGAGKVSRGTETEDMQQKRSKDWSWAPAAFFTGIPFVPTHKTGYIGLLRRAGLACIYTGVFFSLYYWVEYLLFLLTSR